MGSPYKRFTYLVSSELLIAGVTTTFLAASQGLDFTLTISIFAVIAGLFGLCVPVLLKRKSDLGEKAIQYLREMPGKIVAFLLILLPATIFLTLQPPARVVFVVSPMIICAWLIGVEILLLIDSPHVSKAGRKTSLLDRKAKMLGISSIFLAYGFLLLPSHVPSWFDGFPWDSRIEFCIAACLLPLTIVISWNVIAERFFVISLLGLFVIKLLVLGFLPQSGLGVHTYTSEAAAAADQWERSYYTVANPAYTQVINRPYTKFREFPVEWINESLRL